MEKTLDNLKTQLYKLLEAYDLPVAKLGEYTVSRARYIMRRKQQAAEASTLQYGEYTGIVEYDPDKDLFFGTTTVNGKPQTYESENYEKLQEAFEEATKPRVCRGLMLYGEKCFAEGVVDSIDETVDKALDGGLTERKTVVYSDCICLSGWL